MNNFVIAISSHVWEHIRCWYLNLVRSKLFTTKLLGFITLCNTHLAIDVVNLWYIEAELTHWGRVTDICVGELTTIGPDNGLSPGRRQAIIWTNAGILLIAPLGTNCNEILIEIHIFSFRKMHLKMSSAKWRPFCRGLNVLKKILILGFSPCSIGGILKMAWARPCISKFSLLTCHGNIY